MSLTTELIEWLRHRGEPDSGIRYEARNPHSGERISHVELHGSDADFIVNHFHGQGARDLADALSLIEAERDKLREALVVIEDGEGDAQEIARQTLALHPTDNDHGDGR